MTSLTEDADDKKEASSYGDTNIGLKPAKLDNHSSKDEGNWSENTPSINHGSELVIKPKSFAPTEAVQSPGQSLLNKNFVYSKGLHQDKANMSQNLDQS